MPYFKFSDKLQDAAKEAEKERERLIEIQRQFEARKRELFDKESGLRTKEAEFEVAINKTKAKEVRINLQENYQFQITIPNNSREPPKP